MELKNKVVVITGGTGGISLCIIKQLLRSYDVKYIALLELDLPKCREVFKDLQNDYGDRIGFYPCDVLQTSLIDENFDKVIASHGTIDVLINNAAVAGEYMPETLIDVNLTALILASYALIERIGKHKGGKGGLIVNMASTKGLMNTVAPAYCASKSGVISFTRTMKESYEVTGVSLVALCPGETLTPLLNKPYVIPEFVDKRLLRGPFREEHVQTEENAAAAVINIIQNGECGDVWVSENEEPPYSVGSVEDYRSLKIKDYPA